MKKGMRLGFLFLALIAGNLMAAPEPSWYRNKEIDYPDRYFISAVGTGMTPKDAETDAMKGIALYFKSTVSAQEELISQYTQVVSTKSNNTKKDAKQEATKESVLKSAVVVTTQAEMRGVRFTSHWFNEQSQRWAVLGYINRQEALQMYQNRIHSNRAVIDALLSVANEEIELLYKYDYVKSAALIARMVEEDNRASADVSAAAPNMGDILQYTRKIIADYNALRSQLVFDVQIDSDRQDRIRRKLFEVLEKQGYVTAPNRGTYTIVGTISTSEEALPAGNFVRSGITLQLVNYEGYPLFSYSNNYPRRGSRNLDAAYNTAFRGIEEDLENNFISQFNTFIGD